MREDKIMYEFEVPRNTMLDIDSSKYKGCSILEILNKTHPGQVMRGS